MIIVATHRLKTLSPYFEDLASGRKTFEVRLNDRDYQVGDELLLEHWADIDPRTGGVLGLVPGSRLVRARIIYVYSGRFEDSGSAAVEGQWDITPGFVVLGLEMFPRRTAQGVMIGGQGNVQHNTFTSAPSYGGPVEYDPDLSDHGSWNQK